MDTLSKIVVAGTGLIGTYELLSRGIEHLVSGNLLAGALYTVGGLGIAGAASYSVLRKQKGEEQKKQEKSRLHNILSKHVVDYSKLLARRKETKGKEKELQSAYEKAYRAKQQDSRYLKKLINALAGQPVEQKFESGELIVDQGRRFMQQTFYVDYLDYVEKIGQLGTDMVEGVEEIGLEQFEQVLSTIGRLARSVKTCFDFYLYVCRDEKDKFTKFWDYGVLPLNAGNPNGIGFYKLVNERQLDENLGDDFDYGRLDKFKELAKQKGINFNPSIPEAFEFLDQCVRDINNSLSFLLMKGKTQFFNLYPLVSSEAYKRLEFIQSKLEELKPIKASAEFYLERVREYKQVVQGIMERNGLKEAQFPEGEEMVTSDQIDSLEANLEELKRIAIAQEKKQRDIDRKQGKGTTIVYQSSLQEEQQKGNIKKPQD
ncbi:hypothetical protein KY331_01800 [Candidatus Woesearchaeota archaeon]|nr:hypothetical protein [Candidatus Woesearchaeota archaeon]